MAASDSASALNELARHPYVVVPRPGDPAGVAPLTGPLPVAEVLDLGFGAADALVEVHARGLAVDGLHAGSLVTAATGEPRLAIDAVRVGDAAGRAADVSALRRALDGLLPDGDDPTTRATRVVLDDDAVPTAAALRDALAAVRLGERPGPPPIKTVDEVGPSGPGGERVGGSVDPAERLQGRRGDRDDPPVVAPLRHRRALTVAALVAVVAVVGVAVAVWFALH